MNEIIVKNGNAELCPSSENGLIELSNGLLLDACKDLGEKRAMRIPISEITTLGIGVSSLLPVFRTVTTSTVVNTQGIYRIANAGIGDALQAAKNGNFWPSIKSTKGMSKLAQLEKVGELNASQTTVMPIDPATLMMAAALYSIEKQLGNIEEMQKQMMSHLEYEKESEVEGDLATMFDIIQKYKYNWDNEHYIASNHKMVLDIQRSARQNMLFYQKKFSDAFQGKKLLIVKKQVDGVMQGLLKDFKYYRLSLYTFAMASLVEVMLSGNFKSENILENKLAIEKFALQYREQFSKCSQYLEKMADSSIEYSTLKDLGNTGKALGKFIGSIPLIKNGPIDDLLQEAGSQLQRNAEKVENSILQEFSSIHNPCVSVFTEKLQEMESIYNRASDVYLDEKNVYLVTN